MYIIYYFSNVTTVKKNIHFFFFFEVILLDEPNYFCDYLTYLILLYTIHIHFFLNRSQAGVTALAK